MASSTDARAQNANNATYRTHYDIAAWDKAAALIGRG
jgi:hypothetical protein